MNKTFEGKVVVVTGGASGIGLATAKRFSELGAAVYVTGRREAELAAAVKAIGGDVTGVQGDASKLADLDTLYDTVQRRHAHIDVLVPNAGGEIHDIHNVRVRNTDAGEIVNFHCRAAPSMSVIKVHEHVDAIERALRHAFPSVKRVISHAEPPRA